jgi:hypothetical protein
MVPRAIGLYFSAMACENTKTVDDPNTETVDEPNIKTVDDPNTETVDEAHATEDEIDKDIFCQKLYF